MTRSTLASLSFMGQVTKHATVKWSIERLTHFFSLSSFLSLLGGSVSLHVTGPVHRLMVGDNNRMEYRDNQ